MTRHTQHLYAVPPSSILTTMISMEMIAYQQKAKTEDQSAERYAIKHSSSGSMMTKTAANVSGTALPQRFLRASQG